MSNPCENCGSDIRVCKDCDIYNGKYYTNDEVIAMFTEIQLEIEKHTMTSGVTNQGTWNECIACCNRLIQQKIDDLKGDKDGVHED